MHAIASGPVVLGCVRQQMYCGRCYCGTEGVCATGNAVFEIAHNSGRLRVMKTG